MKKLAIAFGISGLALASFLLFDTHSAQAATLYSYTESDETQGLNSGGETYTNGSGGGCTTQCSITASGNLATINLLFSSQSGGVIIDSVEMLNDLGNPVGCDADADCDTPGLSMGHEFQLVFAEDALNDCDIDASDIRGMRFLYVGGTGTLTLYGGDDGSVTGKVFQVWADAEPDPPPPSDGDGFSFVQFEPSLFGRTIRDWSPYYSVRYSSPSTSPLPLWIQVQVSTSSDFSTTVASTSQNVWTRSGIANFDKDPLSDGGYFSRITLATSTDFVNTILAQTTGSFNINSSSTDGINCTTGGANPGCSNNATSTDENASTTVNNAIIALNCTQYDFITEYDAVLFTFPFFSIEAPQRVGCEVLSLIYQGGQVLIIPGKVIDGRAAVTSQLTEFKTVLPFVLYFGTLDAVQNGLMVGASTTPATLGFIYPGTLEPDMLNPDAMNSFTVLTTTTLTDFLQHSQYCDFSCANSIKNTYFNWMRVIIWAGTGLIAVAIIL